MRLPCLFVVLPAAVALAGCATQAPPRYAEALAQDLTQQPGLDALMYRAAQPASPAVQQVSQVMAPLDPYTLDAGDRLRIVVFGQDALSNSYIVGASGVIAVPLVGTIPARGLTTTQLAGAIAARLRRGFVRDPSVSVEVETYRPFFVLGEVTYPGQYPYVPNMTVESAVAIAGGFTPRALRNQAEVTRRIEGAPARIVLPLTERLRPGDTQGHQVGIVASTGGDAAANERLAALADRLTLGVTRFAMERQLGLGDVNAVRHVGRLVARLRPNVLHGHGAKGGAYARLVSGGGALRVYTPHGGSLHYGRHTPRGMLYGAAERMLLSRTDLFLFESKFARDTYRAAIGTPQNIVRVVPNGVGDGEFEPVRPHPDAADLVTIGELRHIKGIDVMIEAMALLARGGRNLTATVIGAGPDEQDLRTLVRRHELDVHFAGHQPARRGFALGRLLVVPSRAESLPYIVLEAAAAEVPMLASAVGGIPEVIEPPAVLVPPGDPQALAEAIAAALDDPPAATAAARQLRERVRTLFSQDAMVAGVLAAYRFAIATKFHRSP